MHSALLDRVRFTRKRHGYDPDEVDGFLRRVGAAIEELRDRVASGEIEGLSLGSLEDDFAAQLATVRFGEARPGYDPDEVDNFLGRVAVAVGQIQNRLRPPEGASPLGITLFRVALPVDDMERAVAFYEAVLGTAGRRMAPGRHYFECGATILACFDATARRNGDDAGRVSGEHVCFAVRDVEEAYARVRDAGPSWIEPGIVERPSGERSFYAKDPFGNPLCFVDQETAVTVSDQAR